MKLEVRRHEVRSKMSEVMKLEVGSHEVRIGSHEVRSKISYS